MQVFRRPMRSLEIVGCPAEAGSETSHLATNTFTPVFCCGFECGTENENPGLSHWVFTANNPAHEAAMTFDTTIKRTGLRSLRFNLSSQECNALCRQFYISTYPPYFKKYITRFYIYFTTLPSADTFLAFVSEASNGFTMGLAFKQSDSKLYVSYNTVGLTPSTFGTTGIAVTTGIWYRIDLKLDAASGAKTLDAKVNGVDVGGLTSTSTGTDGQGFRLGPGATISGDWYYDDFIASQTLADYPFGEGYVTGHIPRCDGSHNAGTNLFRVGSSGMILDNSVIDSYQYIDDVPLEDATATAGDFINQFNAGSSNYMEWRFGPMPGVAHPTIPPRAVEVALCYHQENTGAGNSTFKINDNGTEDTVLATGQVAGVTSVRTVRKHYANPPTGLGGWKVDGQSGNFKQLKFRFGYSSDASPDQYLDSVMVEAEFSSMPSCVTDADARAYLRAVDIYDTAICCPVNTFFVALKAAGLYTKIDAGYLFLGGTADKHKYSFVDPQDLDSSERLTWNGNWTHDANGITGDGSTTWADTYYQSGVDLGSVDSSHLAVYTNTDPGAGNKCDVGRYNGFAALWGVFSRYTGDKQRGCAYTFSGGGFCEDNSADGRGFQMVQRVDLNTTNHWKDGVKLGTTLGFSTSPPVQSVLIGAQTSTPTAVSDRRITYVSMGASMSDADALAYYNIVQTLMTALGRDF